MNAGYQLVMERTIPGFATRLDLHALYREQERVDSALQRRGLAPLHHYVCPVDLLEPDDEVDDMPACWFDADIGRRMVRALVDYIHGNPQAFGDAVSLLEELFALNELLETAHMSGNRWHLGLEVSLV